MDIMNKLISTLICWIIWVPLAMAANHLEMEFNLLSNRDGLSNGQVNTILQDKQGYVWFGTQSGLDRYDGFRFKNFFYNNLDVSSLANNSVDEIQQDVLGNLWIHTAVGYCIYQYSNEKFDRNPEKWLKKIGIEGYPQKVFIEANKNMWFVMYGKGVFFLDTKTMKHKFFSFAQLGVKDQKEVSCVTEQQGTAVFSFRNGTLCRVDGLKGKVLWVNRHLTQTCHIKDETVYTFIDCHNNYWVLSNDFVYVYSSLRKKWYDGMGTFIKSLGISMPTDNKILIREKLSSTGTMLYGLVPTRMVWLTIRNLLPSFQPSIWVMSAPSRRISWAITGAEPMMQASSATIQIQVSEFIMERLRLD